MKTLATLIASALLITPLAPSHADDYDGYQFYANAGGWLVYKANVPGQRNRCELRAATDKYTVLIAFAPVEGALLLGFTIADGANFPIDKDIAIKVALMEGTELYRDWIYADARVHANAQGENHRTFYARMPDPEPFLRDFARAENIAIFTDPGLRLMASVNLNGSGKAVDLLRRCAYSLKAN